jgi:hypothetical protein
MRAPEGLKELKKIAISNYYEVYATKEFQMEGKEEFQMEDDPTSFEEAMRSVHSSKWLEATRDEMRSISTNDVCDLEKIPKGAKTVGCK